MNHQIHWGKDRGFLGKLAGDMMLLPRQGESTNKVAGISFLFPFFLKLSFFWSFIDIADLLPY